MAFTLCTSQQAKLAAGLNMNSTLQASSSDLNLLNEEAEDYINVICRYDVVTNYGSLTSAGKKMLGMFAANLTAQKMITYDEGNYTTGAETDSILNVLENQINRCETLLKDSNFRKYLGIDT